MNIKYTFGIGAAVIAFIMGCSGTLGKIKTKSGNDVYVETYGIPLIKDGKIYAILGIGNNITERKIAEQRLNESGEMFKAIYKEGPIPAYTWQKIDDDFTKRMCIVNAS